MGIKFGKNNRYPRKYYIKKRFDYYYEKFKIEGVKV
jgi:hypothetical protein